MKKLQGFTKALALSVVSIAAVPAVVAQEGQTLEEIVVTGIRSSLEAAADLKRNDSRIIDAIVAEDIGKLPDNNIAEALQRVTGVSINREYGVGNEVSIRGLPDNRVEINGRSTLGDSRNGISLDDMPSAFLAAVEVIKSPTPEMIEGALGGTVNMKTVRPLDLKDQVISLSADMEYADKTGNVAPILNGTYGNNWNLDNGGSFGVVASLSYQDRELRQDTFQQDLRVQDGFDINNDGVIDASDEAQNTPSGNYIISREHKYEPWVETRERTAANVSFQWAPSDRGSLYLDLNFTERDGGEEAYSVLMAGGSAVNTGQAYEDASGQLSGYELQGAFILPKTWSEFRKTESFSHAFGGDFDITDDLNFSFEYATAESDQEDPKSEFNWRAHDVAAEALNPNASNEYKVDALIDVSNHNAVPGVDYLTDENPFLDTDKLALREFRHVTDNINNSEDALRFDLELSNPGGLEWFSSIKAGYRMTDREYEISSSQFRRADLHRYLGDANTALPTVITMPQFDAAYPGTLVNPFQPSDLFDQAGYSSANQTAPFVLYDAALLSQDLEGTFDIIKAALAGTCNLIQNSNTGIRDTCSGVSNDLTGTLASNLAETESAYAKIVEDTSAVYLQANLDFDTARIVFGGRYVETEVTSSAYQAGVIVSDTETYSDFLPSINVSVDLTDNTILRASGAKVMRRADFSELSPAYIFNSDIITAGRGNPGLEPFRAAQFDFGIEHYWDGNMISATVFYKDVASFLKDSLYCAYLPDDVANQNHAVGAFDQVCILPAGLNADSETFTDESDLTLFNQLVADGRNGVKVTTQTNGSNGTIQGFELGTVYNFSNLPGAWSNLGINANYTYSQSEDPDGTPLEDISEGSYNVQLFWENETISARIAYTSRGRFLDDTQQKRTEHIGELVTSNTVDLANDPTQGNSFRDGIDQLDVSGSWNVNDQLTVVGSITNLTGEPLINSSIQGVMWQVRESDRRFSLGLRYTF